MKYLHNSLLLCTPFILLAGCFCKNTSSENKKLVIPNDRLTYWFDKRLENSLTKNLPKNQPCVIKRLPELSSNHRLTERFEFHIQLPTLEVFSQKDAIEIAIPYIRSYLDTLNNFREIRPYLWEFPISLSTTDFTLVFAQDPDTNIPLSPPNISGLYFCKGIFGQVRFGITQFDKESFIQHKPQSPHINICSEPDQLPKALLQLEKPQYDKKEPQGPIPIPENKTYSHLSPSGKPEFNFCKELAQNNSLSFLALSHIFPVTKKGERRMCSTLAFGAQEKRLTLKEARDLLLKLRDLHAPFYIRKQLLNAVVNEARHDGIELLSNPINAQQYFSMRISFWDQFIDRIKPPYIAEIRMYGTKAQYYISDDLQRLQLVHEEELPPYEIEIPVPDGLLKEKPKEH